MHVNVYKQSVTQASLSTFNFLTHTVGLTETYIRHMEEMNKNMCCIEKLSQNFIFILQNPE